MKTTNNPIKMLIMPSKKIEKIEKFPFAKLLSMSIEKSSKSVCM